MYPFIAPCFRLTEVKPSSLRDLGPFLDKAQACALHAMTNVTVPEQQPEDPFAHQLHSLLTSVHAIVCGVLRAHLSAGQVRTYCAERAVYSGKARIVSNVQQLRLCAKKKKKKKKKKKIWKTPA
eukprot:TRINITY_DN106577_c0_g1_i1.p2 TRINITY_DN106577_c0_g1~~TRINITY_DN106577_c0_g1_i1.p2  ORF type:complete len:124 (-),score=5.36 TRINITY_DN106577_c0_g1_i1:57-428(-)